MASEGQTSLLVGYHRANCVLGLPLPLFKENTVAEEFTMIICGSSYQTVSLAELQESPSNLTAKAFLIAFTVILEVEFSTLKFRSPVGEKKSEGNSSIQKENYV